MTVIRSFEDLKRGFGDYLEQLSQENEKNYNLSGSEISIFMYADEFNEYMQQNKFAIEDYLQNNSEDGQKVSIDSMNISEILNMTCKDGKVLNGDEFETEISQEEGNVVAGVLYDLLQDETFKSAFDLDSDGDLTEEDFAGFLNTIKDYDENGEDTISLEDIMQAVKEIALGIFDIEKESEEAEEPEQIDDEETIEDTSIQNSPRTSSAGGTSSGSYYPSSTGSNSSQLQLSEPDTMTAEEIKAEITTEENTLSSKKQELADAKADTTPDDKFEDYMKELKKKDAGAAKDIEKYKNQIDTIKQIDQEITEQTGIKETAENTISNVDSQIANIDSSISQLQSTIDSADEDTDTSILTSQIQELEAQKRTAEQEKSDAETAKSDAEKRITELEAQKEGMPSIQELEKNIADLEDDFKNDPEIGPLMDDYHTAQDEKDAEIESLNEEISKLETHIQELRDEYTKVQKTENEENTKSAINKATMQYDEEAGKELVETALAHLRGTTGYCLGGVNDALQIMYGERINAGSAYLAADILAQDTGIGAHFTEVEVSPEEISSLPAGAIIVWDRGGNASSAGQIHGHISISDGNGQEISDYVGTQTTYEKRQASYRVFYPID